MTAPRVLFAIDLDADTEGVLDAARPLLERLGEVVDLVHVETSRVSAFVDAGELSTLISAAAEQEAELHRERMGALLARLPAERRGTVTLAWNRATAEEIVRRAAGHDLLVVATHARRAIRRAWLGSVAERVVRSSPVPVLVLEGRGTADPGPRPRLLVAVDLQDDATALLREAARWAARLGAPMDLVAVLPVYQPFGGFRPGPGWGADLASNVRKAEFLLAEHLDPLPDEARGSVRVAAGDPADEILSRAEGHAVLIVGTSGRRGAERFWLGSVAERLARQSPIPVLVVPTGPRS